MEAAPVTADGYRRGKKNQPRLYRLGVARRASRTGRSAGKMPAIRRRALPGPHGSLLYTGYCIFKLEGNVTGIAAKSPIPLPFIPSIGAVKGLDCTLPCLSLPAQRNGRQNKASTTWLRPCAPALKLLTNLPAERPVKSAPSELGKDCRRRRNSLESAWSPRCLRLSSRSRRSPRPAIPSRWHRSRRCRQ